MIFNRDFLKHITNKKILSKFNERIKTKYEIIRLNKINLFTNNYCNLKCYSCSSLCDIPMGKNTFRDRKRRINDDMLNLALSKLIKYKSYDAVTFYGGEPTSIPLEHLKKLSTIVRSYNLKSIILTNGFNVCKLDPYDYDYFILDNHGININDIKESEKHFKENNFKKYYINKTLIHKNLIKARKEKVFTKVFKCESWMKLSIWKDLIYPCCAMPQIEGFDNDNLITESLRKNGWSIKDPNLINNIINWKKTIPKEVIRKCLFSCWKFRKNYEERNIEDEYLKLK